MFVYVLNSLDEIKHEEELMGIYETYQQAQDAFMQWVDAMDISEDTADYFIDEWKMNEMTSNEKVWMYDKKTQKFNRY